MPAGRTALETVTARRRRRRLGHFLVAATSEHDWERPSPEAASLLAGADLGMLAFAASYHGIVGCVYRSLRGGAALPAKTRSELTARYHAGISMHLRALGDLGTLAGLLEEASMPWLLVKGPALAERTYRHADLRTYKDLDVVVPPGSFGALVGRLESAGVPLLDRDWVLVRQQLRGQLHLRLPAGTTADLHWHLVNQGRERFRIDMHDLFERARLVTLAGVTTRVLDPVDALLHLCVHAALSGGDRLIWLKDIEQTLLRDQPDWSQAVDRAHEWNAQVPVGIMLAQTAAALQAPVPDEVVRDLLHVRHRVGLRVLDRLRPTGSRLGEPSLSRLLVRNAGRGPAGIAIDATRRLRHRLLDREDRAAASNPLLRDRGDDGDRAAFLAEVTDRAW